MENKIIKIFLWIITTILLFTGITTLMTMACFIANLFGIFLIGIWLFITIKTTAFLNISFKKKHENKD